MNDSFELYGELRLIRERMEGFENMQEVLVRAHGEIIEKQIWDRLTSDRIMARIYLLVDGTQSQREIVEALKAAGSPGASDASVSRKLDVLSKELHLVELVDRNRAGKIYRRTALDNILGIGRKLNKKLSDDDGRD